MLPHHKTNPSAKLSERRYEGAFFCFLEIVLFFCTFKEYSKCDMIETDDVNVEQVQRDFDMFITCCLICNINAANEKTLNGILSLITLVKNKEYCLFYSVAAEQLQLLR